MRPVCCVSNILKDSDSDQLDKMGKISTRTPQGSRLKKDVLSDVYGDHQDRTYITGLAECKDGTEFLRLLQSVKSKWDLTFPGFHDWFSEHHAEK